MKNYILLLITLFIFPFSIIAQENETKEETKKVKEKLERPAFESSFLFDNPTNVLFNKNTLEVVMSHRFGLINGGTNDMAGFWAPSNIRIALAYSISDRLAIGYGTTKFDRLQDFNLKGAILRQTRSNKIPLSISYYGNFTISAKKKDNFSRIQDRYSWFNQIIFARRISPKLSLQIAPSISHYNLVKSTMKNDMFAVAFGGRYKISPQTSIIIDYSLPISDFGVDKMEPGFSIGAEFGTSAHTFQIFASNLNGIVPQKNYVYNQNDFFKGDFLIGFNITRNYNF